MIVNGPTLDLAFRGFKTVYSDAYLQAPSHFDQIAMAILSLNRAQCQP